MLKQQARLLTTIAIALDLLIVFGSFLTAFYLRRPYLVNRELNDYFWFLMLIMPTWFVALYVNQLYASLRTRTTWSLLLSLIKAYTVAGCVSAAAIFILDPHTFSRMLFIWFMALACSGIVTAKLLVRWILAAIRRRGLNTRNILLVGNGSKAQEMRSLLMQHEFWGLRLLGTLTNPDNLDAVVQFCKQNPVDEVVFCLPASSMNRIEQYVTRLDRLGVTSRMVLDLVDFPAHRQEISLFHDTLPMLTFYSKAFSASQLLAKRCLDIAGALIGLLLLGLMLPW